MYGRRAIPLTVLLASALVPALGSAANVTWTGGVGEWNTPLNWSGGLVPGPTDSAFVTNAGIVEHLSVIAAASVGAFTLSDGGVVPIPDTVTVHNGVTFTLGGGGLLNDGTFNLNSNGTNTTLNFQGAQTAAGRGAIVMGDRTTNRITTNNTVFTNGNGFGHTIRGAGQLLANSGGLRNHSGSSIIANGVNALVIDPNGLGVTNEGTLSAQGSGGLNLINGIFTNETVPSSGLIEAQNASHVDISGATVIGGNVNSSGTGVINPVNTTFDGVTFNGTINQANGTTNTIKNGLALTGTWNLASAGTNTDLAFSGEQAVSGTGTIALGDNAANRITTNNQILSIDAGISVIGAGQLLANTGGMVNKGTVRAEGANALVIDPNGLKFENQGTLEAAGSGGLVLQNSTFDLGTTAVDILANSKLDLTGSTVNGGTLNIDGTANATLSGNTLNGVEINGDITHNNGVKNIITNGLTLNGTWNLGATGANTDLDFSGAQTLGGNAEVVMSDNLTNRLTIDNKLLTIGANTTVRGAGQLLANTGGVLNLGTIRADGAAAIVLDVNGLGFENQGTVEATGAGGLVMQNSVFNLATTAIDILANSKLDLTGSTVNGGTLNIDGTANATLSGNTLNGVEINGDITHNNGVKNIITNGLTLNGTWNLGATGANTDLDFSGAQTLGGNAEVVMSDNLTNRLTIDNKLLTIGANTTVRGAGQLLANTGGVLNLGTIRADGAAAIVLDVNGLGFENQGTVEATGAGGLVMQNSVFNLATTAIDILANSKLALTGSTVNGGTLNIDGTANATLSGNTLNGVEINGDITHNNGVKNIITNGLTLNGTWNLGATGANTDLDFSGAQTLGGNAEVVMSDNLTNRLTIDNKLLTIGANTTVRGAGQLLANTGGVLNLGTIRADGAAAIVLDVNGLGFENQGTVEATGAGGLVMQNSVFNLATTAIDILANSKLDLTGSTVNGGTLNIDGTANATLSGNTLNGVEINGDITHNNGVKNIITNGLTLNGTWNLGATGANTDLDFSGAQTLGGNGQVVMSENLTNRLTTNNKVLTIGTVMTVRGGGQILANTGGLNNLGTIHANSDVAALTIDPNGLGFTNNGNLLVTGDAGLNSIGGFVQDAGLTRVNTVLSASAPVTIVGGVLAGGGQINGDVNNAGGTVNPGNSPGELTINGDYSQSGQGQYLVEIAGANAAAFDVLSITGTATLGGTLDVDLLGFIPTVGTTFDVLFAAVIDGTFDNTIVDTGNVVFAINIVNDSLVRLTTVSAVPIPAALWLMASTIALLLGGRRLRR